MKKIEFVLSNGKTHIIEINEHMVLTDAKKELTKSINFKLVNMDDCLFIFNGESIKNDQVLTKLFKIKKRKITIDLINS